jgi:hypothetical protein
MWDAPQGFRGCLPPPPIWPETRLRLRDLHQFAETKKQEGEAQERAVQEEQLSIYMLAALNKFWMRGQSSASSWM